MIHSKVIAEKNEQIQLLVIRLTGFLISTFIFDKADKGLFGEKTHRQNADLIENDQRTSHEQLIDDIRCGRQNGGDDKGDKKGVFTVFRQKRRVNNTDLGKKDHQHRQFKDHAECKQQPQGQGKILTDRRHGVKKLTGVADQKPKCGGKDDKITKGRTAYKTEGGDEGKREQDLFFMLVQARSDKTPYLEKNNRTGGKNTADKGELQIKKNPSW